VTENSEQPPFEDVLPSTEQAPRDRREHGKASDRLNDDELTRRTHKERIDAGVEDYDPDDVPPADG
jgi:hypothetical protein